MKYPPIRSISVDLAISIALRFRMIEDEWNSCLSALACSHTAGLIAGLASLALEGFDAKEITSVFLSLGLALDLEAKGNNWVLSALRSVPTIWYFPMGGRSGHDSICGGSTMHYNALT